MTLIRYVFAFKVLSISYRWIINRCIHTVNDDSFVGTNDRSNDISLNNISVWLAGEVLTHVSEILHKGIC